MTMPALLLLVLGGLLLSGIGRRLNWWGSGQLQWATISLLVVSMVTSRVSVAVIVAGVTFVASHLLSLWWRYQPVEGLDDLDIAVERVRWADRQSLDEMLADEGSMAANGWTEAQLVDLRKALGFLRFPMIRPVWFVGRDGEQVVGAVGLSETPGNVGQAGDASFSLTVHPDHRGRGHGRSLGKALLVIARQLEVDVWVGTAADNQALRAIMEGLGFRGTPVPYHAPNGTTFDGLWYLIHPGRAAS